MVFLDANILLEYLLPDRTEVSEVRRLLQTIDQPTVISALTAHLVLHFGRVKRVSDDLLHAAIDRSMIVGLLPEDYHWARSHEIGNDFEDALQISVALRSHCTHFMTLDRPLAKNYQKQPLSFIVP